MNKEIPKCLHISYSGISGISSIIFLLLESKLKKEIKQEILFSGPILVDNYKTFCRSSNIHFSYIKTKYFFLYIKYIIKILLFFKKIRNHKPDIIFLHDFNLIPCLFYKFFYKKTKLVFINHTTLTTPNLWKIKLICKFLFYIDAIVFVNKSDFNKMKKLNKLYSKKFNLIENGINTKKYPTIFFKKKKSKTFKIGMACRVDSSRPYNLIVNSLLEKKIKNLNISFSLCGDGSDFYNFNKFIKEKNLCDKVKLEGYLSDKKLNTWFSSLDLYVQASYGEGMSTALLQAMSMKKLVIGSNVSGIKNFFKSKRYFGMLFRNNVKDLSKKIYFFYKLDKKKRKKYINTQYKLIKTKYSSNKMIDEYKSLINKIL
jgi:glycosyltransferase involved in cell wall biosynthesis